MATPPRHSGPALSPSSPRHSRPASPDVPVVPLDKAKHEMVFSGFLLALAFLFRNSGSITYPELLYVFVAFLTFNFLYNRYLKQKAQSHHLAYSPVFVNGLLITWAMHYSGGPSSYLWVMYLLPIFTACVLYDRWGVVLTTLYVIVLQASLNGPDLWEMDGADWLQLLSKTALLALSASVTARLASSEREAKASALVMRNSFEEALEKIKGGEEEGSAEAPGTLLARGIHDVNTALTVILGSAQLLLAQRVVDGDEREDLGRIESAVRLSKIILQNLFLLGRPREEWPRESSSVHAVLEEALEQCRGEIRSKRVLVDTSLLSSRDAAFLNVHLLNQAFANFLFAAVSATPPEERVRLATKLEGDNEIRVIIEDGGVRAEGEGLKRFFDPHWVAPGRGKGVGLGLYVGREIVLRHGGRVDVSPLEGRGNRMIVVIPLGGTAADGGPIRLKDLSVN